ncbi:type I restriction-modification enzyme R subunit C-terminal domain-containing protein, partial [Enterobacter hormaechei]
LEEETLNDDVDKPASEVREDAAEYHVNRDNHSGNGEFHSDDADKVRKFYVNGVAVKVLAKRVQYYDSDGKLVTESFQDYTRKTMLKDSEYASLDSFVRKWQEAPRKQAIIEELAQLGILWDVLAEEVGKDLDPFDLLCHVVYGQPPLTRQERAANVRKRNYFTKYAEPAQLVLNTLLDKYADEGVQEIEDVQVLKLKPFDALGRPIEIIRTRFGDKKAYEQAVNELENEIYQLPPRSA